MSIMQNYEPKRALEYFEQICAIPHGSGNTKAVSDYCVGVAKKLGLSVIQDETNNVIIRKSASAGYEDAPAVILQGHLDMVCVKDEGVDFDFEKDSLNLYVEDGFLRARGTSLGGDNGIAVAMALALLEDDSIKHPELEVLFTADEETGMYGAEAIDFTKLKGRMLINVDSEEEGVITCGCAGGVRADCVVPVTRVEMSGISCKLTIDGLKGGHSGGEIHKERGSANSLLGRVLDAMVSAAPFDIVTMCGGTVENAIPSSSYADLIVKEADLPAIKAVAEEFDALLRREYASSDEGIKVTLSVGQPATEFVTDSNTNENIAFAMLNLPFGVQVMSMDIQGLVQTSLNMGVLRMNDAQVQMSFSVRSSVSTQKEWLCRRLETIMKRAGGSATFHASYPAWEFRRESALRDIVVESCRKVLGKDPVITATHGGLECGLFSGKAPDLDCVSIGPDLFDVHSTAEHLDLASTARTYKLLVDILENCR